MVNYINAGFGDPIGQEGMDRYSKLFTGIRRDVRMDNVFEYAAEFRNRDILPLLLVNGGHMDLDQQGMIDTAGTAAHALVEANRLDGAIELGNEPDIAHDYWKRYPRKWAETVHVCHENIKSNCPSLTVVSGGVANTDERGLSYLERANLQGLDLVIGYHSYRTTRTPSWSHPGFNDRGEEFERLQVIAAGRRIWCTECGWHTAPSTVNGPVFGYPKKSVQFDDFTVARFVREELALHDVYGCETFCYFQAHDGLDENEAEARFGVWDIDWKEKLVGQVFREEMQ